MALSRKFGGDRQFLQLAAANNTSASVLAAVYSYDPNPLGTYDAALESIQEIGITPYTAFSHTGNSFTLDLQVRDASGNTVGSAVTLWDGTATDGVAFVALNANPKPFIQLLQGYTFSLTWTKVASGSSGIPATTVTFILGPHGA